MWKHLSDAAKKKAKQRWAVEKPKLENARQLRGILLIEPTTKNSRSQWTPLVERWKFRCHQQCIVKHRQRAVVKHTAVLGNARQNMLCVVDADESTTPRLEGAVHKHHEDHITAKGMNSVPHYSLVHKFIPMPRALKIPDAQAAVVTEWEKLERRYRHGS